MRLIDADTIVHYQTYDDEHEEFPEHESTIADFLDEMADEGCPKPVDAVPVVRCGECKYLMPNGHCTMFADDRIRPSSSDFCSAGERKDGDGNG